MRYHSIPFPAHDIREKSPPYLKNPLNIVVGGFFLPIRLNRNQGQEQIV
jgi:hypothetical protein